ncbi:MAG: polysaccharide deacetylase family protein [Bacteroidota bacterium]|nr:polysaccharide deacetylase family protein [Bacteroidota bacterium]
MGYHLRLHRFFKSSGPGSAVTALCLHRINPVNDILFPPLTPGVFAALIRILKKEYEITGFEGIHELVASPSRKKPALVLSFDDGYKDFLEYGLPIIRKEKITVNHNIVINCAETGQLIWTQRLNNILSWLAATQKTLDIDFADISMHKKVEGQLLAVKAELFRILFSRPYTFVDALTTSLEKKYSFSQPAGEMMNWEDIITCQKEGVEIGSHTICHGSLGHYDDAAFVNNEIAGSKKILEEKLKQPVHSLAFPNGWAHPAAYEAAIKAGYKNLLLIDSVKYDFDLKPGPCIYPYKRILVGHPSVYENVFNIAGFHKALRR